MAVYKVPQDVEADDKLIGPLSFKQFTFALITIGLMWLAWQMFSISPFLVIIPLPFILAFGILATPLRKDQPTDVYVAALINFWMRPKVRLWNQEGMLEHVIVTAPKKTGPARRAPLSQTEIHSRLNNLALMMDTRGWSTKNVAVEDSQNLDVELELDASDRILTPLITEEPVDELNIKAEDDVLDEESNLARNFDRLEDEATRRVAAQRLAGQPTVASPPPVGPPVGGLEPSEPIPGSVYRPGDRAQPIYASPSMDTVEPLVIPTAQPYPRSMHQTVIQPIHDSSQLVGDQTMPMTPPATDVIVKDNSDDQATGDDQARAFEEGGEISLH